jgi:hypothetical protein
LSLVLISERREIDGLPQPAFSEKDADSCLVPKILICRGALSIADSHVQKAAKMALDVFWHGSFETQRVDLEFIGPCSFLP